MMILIYWMLRNKILLKNYQVIVNENWLLSANNAEIVEKVEEYVLDLAPFMPDFPIPDGFEDADAYLRHLAFEGAHERWGEELAPDVVERLDFELDTIKKMSIPQHYFNHG